MSLRLPAPLNAIGRGLLTRAEADHLNRLSRSVTALSSLRGPGMVAGGFGYALRTDQASQATVRLTARTSGDPSFYSWAEVVPAGAGGWVTTGVAGDVSNAPLFEANDRQVDVGTVVRMYLLGDAAYYYFFAPGCGPCDQTPPAPTPGSGSGQGGPGTLCGNCTGQVPTTWQAALAGFTDGTGDCAEFDGTFTLTQSAGDPCTWKYADSLRAFFLDKLPSGYQFRLATLDGLTELEYTGTASNDCCKTQTLTFHQYLTTNTCGVKPGTVTLVPQCGTVPCPNPCPTCRDGVTPAKWSVPVTGFSNGGGGCDWSAMLPFTLATRLGPCQWSGKDRGVADATLQYVSSGAKWSLNLHLGGTACNVSYQAAPAPADCCAPVTFTRVGSAAGTPATLVLTPSGGCCPATPPGGVGTVPTTCCANLLPATLFCTMQAAGCPCMALQTVTLTWNGSTAWTGSAAFGTCGTTVALTFKCDKATCPAPGDPLGFSLRVVLSGGLCSQDETHCENGGATCSPLSVGYTVTGISVNCCPAGGGALTLTVTETSP